jgi:hypothetical protein
MLKILLLLSDDGFWIVHAFHGGEDWSKTDPLPIFPKWCIAPMDDFPSDEESKNYYKILH